MLQNFNVDPDRVYMAGRSMGGVGTSSVGFAYPQIFAALHMLVPQLDFGEPEWNLERPGILDRYVLLWGTVTQSIATSVLPPIFATSGEGLGVYDRVDQIFKVENFPSVDLPPAIVGVGKQDCFAGWHEKPRFMAAMSSARQPLALYWQQGGHSTNFNAGPWATPLALSNLNRHRRNRSHPAFSNFSLNDNPGLGNDCIPGGGVTGSPQGTINGRIDWDETTIVDEPARWEVEIF